jgi:phosphoribosylformylglycinamidine synthase
MAEDCQILCFPGGFSYGDDIAAGRILAQRLKVHLSDLVDKFTERDRLVLGICNGFQVMMRLGIFFPGREESPPATLTLNAHGRFEDRWVYLRNTDSNSIFLDGIETMFLPMAHAEGRFVVSEDGVEPLTKAKQLGLRYCQSDGVTSAKVLEFPTNPNGAQLNIAGISDPTGKIFGLMPHPERHLDYTHHPFWTRRKQQPEHGDGRQIFLNAVKYFA